MTITSIDLLAVIGLCWCCDRIATAWLAYRDLRKRRQTIDRFNPAKWGTR
jgi:hypothetical protein